MSDIITKSSDTHQPIRILSPQLANQIAAGEVVERPASVVKELVENSIDAGATDIHIEIEQGGQKRILVRDNGKGIAKAELELALSRHATSKISSIDDLDNISSMGFRGEALASISSVSRLRLISKTSSQTEAWQAQAEGTQMQVEIEPAAHPDGTSIEVCDLFFNTPARRKFLRSGKTEFQHIEQIIKRIALTRHDIQFVLQHNNRVCYRYSKTLDLKKRVEQVWGKISLASCNKIDYQYENIRLYGWCSRIGEGQPTRDLQYLFVNSRMMKDKLLAHALRQAYEDTLGPQRFPAYVIFLELPADQLDINVHPAKHEVRFHQARQIHDLVFKAITHTIGGQAENAQGHSKNLSYDKESLPRERHQYIQPLEIQREKLQSSFNLDSDSNSKRSSAIYVSNKPSKAAIEANHAFYQSIQEHHLSSSLLADNEPNSSSRPGKPYESNAKASKVSRDSDNKQSQASQESYIFKSPYLVFSTPKNSNLYLMHMRCLLRKIISLKCQGSSLAQALLMPVSISLPKAAQASLVNKLGALNFELHELKQKLILRKVPSELRSLPWASIFPFLDWQSQVPNDLDNEFAYKFLADAWFRSIDNDDIDITVYLSQLSNSHIYEMLQQYAKSLDLSEWMSLND